MDHDPLKKGSWWLGPKNRLVKIMWPYTPSDFSIKIFDNRKAFFASVHNLNWFYKTHERVNEITDPKKKAWALLKVEYYEQ